MTTTKENVAKIQALSDKYPGKIRSLRSEQDVESIDMDVVVGKGSHKDFDNDDDKLPVFISDQLSSGNEVAILPNGKYKLVIFAGYNLFKK